MPALHPTTTRFLSDLCHHEAMPLQLAGYVLYELDCGLSDDSRRLLAAALEGVCGIPAAHRQTTEVPAVAARRLGNHALAGYYRLWSIREVNKYTARLAQLDTPAELLQAWCVLRSTYRSKERAAAALAGVRWGDGRPADIANLKAA